MGELINFNKARKAKAKAADQAAAQQNRARFGRTKAQKNLADARRDKLDKALDQARRGSDETD
jgi:hypothetical protein